MTLETYTSYKESGIEWLGEIPKHWKMQKMKYLGKIFAGLTDKKGDDFSKEVSNDKQPFIPFTNVCNNAKIDKTQMQYVKVKPFEKQNKVQKNDIIFLMSSETLEDIGKCSIHTVEESFYLNSFCKGFRPKALMSNAEFLNYLLQSKTYRNYFSLVGRGFTRINIKQEYINDLFIILPKDDEQTKIASFLDEKTVKIDEVIRQKEKLIELLKERKQIVINEAVTKGLDKTAEFKESGVEWIGKIPKHWEVIKFKHLFYEKKKTHNINLNCGSISFGKVVEKNDEKIPASTKASYQVLNKNEFLINPLNLNYDLKSLRIGLSGLDVVVSSGYIIVNNKQDMDKNYFNWLLHRYDISFMKTLGAGVRQTLNYNDIGETLLVNPPIEEQSKIAKHIETQITKIENAIELQQNYIAKLKEYKATLIDSVVTGKVRIS